MIKKILALTICLSLISSNAYGQELLVSPLNEGQKAPFSGILFSPEADADREKRLLDKDLELKEFKLQAKADLEKLEVRLKATIETLESDIKENEKRETERIAIKNEQIEFLEKELAKNSGDDYIWWYFGGVATGIVFSAAVFALSVWAVSKVDKE